MQIFRNYGFIKLLSFVLFVGLVGSILSTNSYASYIQTYWGDIKGTLSNQTDLQDALDLKANISNVLELDNTDIFTPDADYEPATKKYVDDNAGGGAVDSVNGQTGVVVLDAGDIAEVTDKNYVTDAEAVVISNTSGTNTGDQVSGDFDHGGLTGLTDDDHTQYPLLTGRSGGQTLIGGTDASDNLTLQSTSNATKGKIYFGANQYFDEANEKLVSTNNGFLLQEETGDTFNLTQYGIEYEAETLDIFQFRAQTPNATDATFRLEARAGQMLVGNSVEWKFGNFPLNILSNRFATFGDSASYIQYPTGFNQVTPTAQAHIKGSTSNSSAYALKVDDSSASNLFSVRNDGLVVGSGILEIPTVRGGDGASEDLTLSSTSNATKGKIYLDDPTYLNTTMYKDISFATNSLNSGIASNPDIGTLDSTSIDISLFDGNATAEEVSGTLEIQHDYSNGTDLVPHIHWYATNANAGNVKWQLEYVIVDVSTGGTVTSSTTISVTDATPATAWKLVTTNFSAISGTSIEIGDQIHFKLFRDPSDVSDTYGSDVATATLGFHYQVDSFGSATAISK